jgi:hypothetical protein
MNYDLENKLRDKADKWEVRNVEGDINRLKNEINNLEIKISHLQSVNNNRYYVINNLLDMLAELPQLNEISNQLYGLKNNL